ncbi:MAG: YeeE/YedE family protein [Lewinellaceae bacterium]|nr:YeeE/YedE family protein [Saprospiraceae bacterium]MCB9338756.1 YeeE/YedE family protein [Lewinellaceae bacterium]
MSTVKSPSRATIKKSDIQTDFEVKSLDKKDSSANESNSLASNFKYLMAGILFGIVLVKSEVISWFRIQEMFKLQSFHMYGVIGTAVVVGAISVFLIKKLKIKTIHGEPITFSDKEFRKGQIFGGLIFGLGWAITGACPGPLFAQLGTGVTVVSITILSAIAGTWVYGKYRDKLPL